MINRIKEDGYLYKHPLGNLVVDGVEVGVSRSGRRSLPAYEIRRLSRLAVYEFLKRTYKQAIENTHFTLNSKEVRAIIVFLGVNQSEFGLLIGCQKSKVSKILRSEQSISKSQALLSLERLAMELVRTGSVRKLLGDPDVELREPDMDMMTRLNELRFSEVA